MCKCGNCGTVEFDATKAHDDHIAPLISQLNNLCDEHGVQFVLMTCQAAQKDGDGMGYTMGASVNLEGNKCPPNLKAINDIIQGNYPAAIAGLFSLMGSEGERTVISG